MEEIIKTTLPDLPEESVIKIKELVENTVKSKEEAIFADATKKTYNNFDGALKELGFEKPDGVKSTDFVKQILNEKKAKIAETSSKIKELETELNTFKNSNSDEKIREISTQLDAVKKEAERLKKDKEKSVTELTQNYENQIKKFAIASMFPTPTNTQLPDETILVLKNMAIETAMQSNQIKYDKENNTLKFYDEYGNIKLNPNKNNEPITAIDFFKSLPALKPLFENNKQQFPDANKQDGGVIEKEATFENVQKFRATLDPKLSESEKIELTKKYFAKK